MKTAVLSGSVLLAAAFAITALPSDARAQFYNYSACPSAQVFYPNGYSNNYCVPSYTPGYPSYPTAPIFSTSQNPAPYYGGGSPYNLYHSPHPFGPWQYNQPFYPYNPTPTYYYPPAPTYPTYQNYNQRWPRY